MSNKYYFGAMEFDGSSPFGDGAAVLVHEILEVRILKNDELASDYCAACGYESYVCEESTNDEGMKYQLLFSRKAMEVRVERELASFELSLLQIPEAEPCQVERELILAHLESAAIADGVLALDLRDGSLQYLSAAAMHEDHRYIDDRPELCEDPFDAAEAAGKTLRVTLVKVNSLLSKRLIIKQELGPPRDLVEGEEAFAMQFSPNF